MRQLPWTRKMKSVGTSCGLLAGLLVTPTIAEAETVEARPDIHLEIGSGEVKDWKLPLSSPTEVPLLLETELTRPDAGPGAVEDVLIGLTSGQHPPPSRWSGEDLKLKQLIETKAGVEVRLRVMARRCAESGTHRASLRFTPTGMPGGPSVEQPLLIEVRRKGPCGSIYLTAGLALLPFLGLGLLLGCGWSMWCRSEFLLLEQLSTKLRPQKWVNGHLHQGNDHYLASAKATVRTGVRRTDRVRAWGASWFDRLRRSPRAALPGGPTYQETFRVELARSPEGVLLSPIPQHAGPAAFQGGPPPSQGCLFAVASMGGGGIRFLAVPDSDGKVGQFSLNGVSPTEHPLARIVEVQGRTLVDYESATEDPDGPAGWRIR